LRSYGRSELISLSRTSMHGYAANGVSLTVQLKRSPIIINWNIGVLVGMMIAATGAADICVGLTPRLLPNFFG
jgi:hypothetical protein